MTEIIYTPTEFVFALNQTLDFAFPSVVLEGELSNFKVAKNRWVYFDLKDEESSVRFFGSVYSLPGPLDDGMKVRVFGSPRLHQRFGFSVNFESKKQLTYYLKNCPPKVYSHRSVNARCRALLRRLV
jgi:exonuclease VII large subunit